MNELKPVVCIGWPTILKLAKGEEVDTGTAILIAADGLHGCHVAPSPVVAEVAKEMREAFALSHERGYEKAIWSDVVKEWADRLERGE